MNAPAPVGIILAAGQGSRMGGAKVLLRLDTRPLVAAHIEQLMGAGCAQICVVVPAGLAGRVTRLIPEDFAPRVTVQAVTTRGPAESLARGWQALRAPRARCVLVTPVDILPAQVSTLRALLRALGQGAQVATPRLLRKNGHPVALCGERIHAFYGHAHQPLPPLRDVVAGAAAMRQCVDVDDPAVLASFNDPHMFAAHTGYAPKFCG